MTFLDTIKEMSPLMRFTMEGVRCLRIHPDVLKLGEALASDPEKLKSAAPFMFMPAHRTWIEWGTDYQLGFLFDGDRANMAAPSVTEGYGMFGIHTKDGTGRPPVVLGTEFNVPGYKLAHAPSLGMSFADVMAKGPPSDMSTAEMLAMWKDGEMTSEGQMAAVRILTMIKPTIWAILALINSPKIIRTREIDITRLNKKRQSLGRYTFHPHHEVRLNVDKRLVTTVAGEGDGSSKCLHFVRTHLRFVPQQGNYTLVSPHWRGDPALGIRDTHYYADRQNSRWPD